MGRFLILGSVSPALMKHVSQSLAGRLSLVELTPFLPDEVGLDQEDSLWFYGGYPDGGILDPSRYPAWQEDYLALLSQRDLPNWGLPAEPMTTQRLFRMLSVLHGQAWNASKIGQSLGLNYQTINKYMQYLIGAFLIRRLEPYHANLKKRLVKSPKVYWRDSGLLHALLRIADYDSLLAHPSAGASWEGFVVEQILGRLAYEGRAFEAFYLRTNEQIELDLILNFGSELWAVEIKLTSAPSEGDVRQLNRAADLIGAQKRILICKTAEPILSEKIVIGNLSAFFSLFER